MIRSKGEAGTGDVSEATKHIRTITGEINALKSKSKDELYVAAKELQAPYELVAEIAATGKLPVVLFTAGGVATPADAALMMQLGADGVFVGSGIFKAGDPAKRAAAIVKATTFFDDPAVIAEASRGLGRRWSASTSPTSRLRTASPSVAGSSSASEPPRSASSPSRATSGTPAVLRELGADAVPVRRESELSEVDGLVIPGGESSVMDKLSRAFGLAEPIKARIADGMPVYGTCAGLIMLADTRPGRDRGAADLRRLRHRRATQRLRQPARLLRDRPGHPGARRTRGARGVHPGSRVESVGRASRCWPRSPTAGSSRSNRATCSEPPSTPR